MSRWPATVADEVPIGDWRKQRFLEWLCTAKEEREPSSQRELAEQLHLHERVLTRWKEDPEFLAAWEVLYRRTVGSPEKAHHVIETLYETATDRTDPRQVPAARAYLEAIDAIKPKKLDVTVTRAAKELSDEELYKILAERATLELNERNNA